LLHPNLDLPKVVFAQIKQQGLQILILVGSVNPQLLIKATELRGKQQHEQARSEVRVVKVVYFKHVRIGRYRVLVKEEQYYDHQDVLDVDGLLGQAGGQLMRAALQSHPFLNVEDFLFADHHHLKVHRLLYDWHHEKHDCAVKDQQAGDEERAVYFHSISGLKARVQAFQSFVDAEVEGVKVETEKSELEQKIGHCDEQGFHDLLREADLLN